MPQGDQPGVGGQETVEEREDGQPDSASAGCNSVFRINHTLTPSYIPLRVIEKVQLEYKLRVRDLYRPVCACVCACVCVRACVRKERGV